MMPIITKTHSSDVEGFKQLKLYKYRSRKIRLTWCKIVCDLIANFDIKKINDLGCNYFKLFKEIYLRKLKYDYFGYDLDQKFINIGLNYVTKLKNLKKLNKKSGGGGGDLNKQSFF